MKKVVENQTNTPGPSAANPNLRTIGPVADLERHLPPEWWKNIFNALYLKTDGDVVENDENTIFDIDSILNAVPLEKHQSVLDICCGQGRHLFELAKRGFTSLKGVDRSRYLVTLARKRAKKEGYTISFSEGDARMPKFKASSLDCVTILGNSFGYFEKKEDDLAVLESVKKLLKPSGHLVLDIVNGPWMKENFEARSWEWIDENYFVCRERSLDNTKTRIISREVICHSENGVIADQFYAERLYSYDDISGYLKQAGFQNIELKKQVSSVSTRNQDLGMMANRLLITAKSPMQASSLKKPVKKRSITVLLGDPSLSDCVKRDGQFNSEDYETIKVLKTTLSQIESFNFDYCDSHSTMMETLVNDKPSLVLNLCDEGFKNLASQELHVPAFLEMLGIPYTGAAPACLAICYDKSLVYSHAATLEVPVPLQTFYNPLDQAANLPSAFPAIIKPNIGDSSIGITKDAVVHSAAGVINHLKYLNDILPNVPVLIQEFLPGDEFSVGIIGNSPKLDVLPILQVDYSDLPNHLPKILSYESKWMPETDYWNKIKYKEACLDEEVKRLLIAQSCKLFEHFNCRDYARFDFRADSNGTIKLLEINPNPGWCWDGKLNIMAGFMGMSYEDLLEKTISAAIDRLKL